MINQDARTADSLEAPPPQPRRTWGEFCGSVVDGLFHPAFTWMALIGLIVGLFILPVDGISFSTCSMKSSTGVPCPGCGLTRSVTSTFNGRFLLAWQYNPFGFGFAVAFALLAPLSLMPGRWRNAIRERVRRLRVPLTILILAFLFGLIAHGIARAVLVQVEHPAYVWWKNGEIPPALVETPQ